MKKLLPLLLVFLVSFAGTTEAPKGENPEPVTITGKLIDTKCYGMAVGMDMPKAAIDNDHMVPKGDKMVKMPACATACANMGIPAGIVEGGEPGGKTYVIIASATSLAEHMAKEARVTGELAYPGGILASKIEVKEDGKWKDVTPGAMM